MKRRVKSILAALMALCVVMTMSVTLAGCQSSNNGTSIENLLANIDGDTANEVSHSLAFEEEYFNEGDATGFRTSGSDADHAAGEYLKETFEKIGLETEIVPVTVDKWETGDKHLNISYKEGGEDKTLEIDSSAIISYMSNGTTTTAGNDKGAGKLTEEQWKSMEIVDAGCGYESDYYTEDGEPIDVKGKIVLVGVNQNNDAWIDSPYEEAASHGAAAIVVYQRTPSEDDEGVGDGLLGCQNGEAAWDTMNVQDICAGDYIPCTGVSPKTATEIKAVLENEKAEEITADFYVESELIPDGGESYEVVGKLAGTGNTGHQIVYGGHYDKYFYGLNDDCTAVGLIAGIASSMVKSGYKPYNDIYFVATGSEEWGESGSQYDWAKGTWEMISEARPEWQGTTLSFIDFEMPAVKSGQTTGYVQSTFEMLSFLKGYNEADLLSGIDAYYADGVDVETKNNDQVYMSDCISYQTCGVPTIINCPDFEAPVDEPMESFSGGWFMDRYHTQYDDDSTYSQELMDYDIAYYGAMGIYMDEQPALELDGTKRIDGLKTAVEGLEGYVDEATLEKYNKSVGQLEEAYNALAAKAQEINGAYAEASDEEKAKLREEGDALNTVSLGMFKEIEAQIMGFAGTIVMPRSQTGSDYMLQIDSLVDMLENPSKIEDMDAFLGTLFGLWGGAEYSSLNWSKVPYTSVMDGFNGLRHSSDSKVEGTSTDDWNTGRRIKAIDTYDAARSIVEQVLFEEKDFADCDFTDAIAIYKAASKTLNKEVVKEIKAETKDMSKIAEKAMNAL